FLAHMSFSILGISIATLFTRNMIQKASTAWLSLIFILLITIASIQFKKELLWFLPPVESFLMLGQYKYNILTHTLWLTAWAIVYSFLLLTL
ncbi:ABC transporter permease, partial [Bacillus wiedmannii]|nr:ABC transporter permease [Bacillus wiedmannii]